MVGNDQGWPGMVGEMVGITHQHTPAHTQTLFSKRPFLVNFFEKFPIILLGIQEYFSYLPDEPYARDLQAQDPLPLPEITFYDD